MTRSFDFFPNIEMSIAPLDEGDLVPPALIAALIRCSRIGFGRTIVTIQSSGAPFFRYGELQVPVGPHVPEGAEVQSADPHHRGGDAIDGGELSPGGVEDTLDQEAAASLGIAHDIEPEPDGQPTLVKEDFRLDETVQSAVGFCEFNEVRDWATLSRFLSPQGVYFDGAEGCLVTTADGTFLATFERLPVLREVRR